MNIEGRSGGPADCTTWLPFLLQTADALFPTGAYAHSLGFEEIVRLEMVHDEATLREFLMTQIVPAQRFQELPYLRFAFDAAARRDINELCSLDREISAWKVARESREASAQIGLRRLKALHIICDAPIVRDWANCTSRGRAAGHHLVTCGVQAAGQNVPLRATLAVYFYQSLAAVCGAALKLIRIGPDGCQRVLRDAARLAERTISDSMTIHRDVAGWFNPSLEIASMRHAHAAERLFIS